MKFDIRDDMRTEIEVDEHAHEIILKPITRQFIRNLRGKYKGSGLMDELMAEKRRERNLSSLLKKRGGSK